MLGIELLSRRSFMKRRTIVQQLSVGILSCLLSVSQLAIAASDVGILTWSSTALGPSCSPSIPYSYVLDGFNSATSTGSYSPTGLTGGTAVQQIVNFSPACYGDSSIRMVISGFTSDPGRDWLTSLTCENSTKFSVDAAYGYSGDGQALWIWPSFFPFWNWGINTTCTIVHN